MGDRNARKFKRQAGCGSKNALRRARHANDNPGKKNRKKSRGKA